MKEEMSGFIAGPYRFRAYKWSNRANESGYVGSLVDDFGGFSEPMYLPSDNLADTAIESRINACTEPTERFEKRGIRGRDHRILGCPAVGALVVTDHELRTRSLRNFEKIVLASAQLRTDEA